MAAEAELHKLIADLEGPEVDRGEEAARRLAKSRAGRKALVGATRSPMHHVRQAAVLALRGRADPDVLAALCERLDDPDRLLRELACNSLAAMGAEAAPALDSLEKLLRKGPDRPSGAAARALGEIGPAAASAGPALVETLSRSLRLPERPLDVTYAVGALWKIGVRDPRLPALLTALLTTGEDALPLDYPAIELLGLQGTSAAEAEPVVRSYLTHGDACLQSAAAAALARIACPEEMVEFLIDRLDEADDDARWFAIEQLASLGRIAAPAVRALRTFVGSPEEERAAADAVDAIVADSSDLSTGA